MRKMLGKKQIPPNLRRQAVIDTIGEFPEAVGTAAGGGGPIDAATCNDAEPDNSKANCRRMRTLANEQHFRRACLFVCAPNETTNARKRATLQKLVTQSHGDLNHQGKRGQLPQLCLLLE